MGARAVRSALLPASWVFGAIVARRNARFDAATLRRAALPSLSVGNLTVGGTGKTPVAAWCVEQLRARGARPAIVMRGVGDDEWRVHGLLNPGTPVIVSADRSDGVFTARARAGRIVLCWMTRSSIDRRLGSPTSCWSAPTDSPAGHTCSRRAPTGSR
jgi:tetraacyldisaccharide 4'-kinase